MREPHGDFGAGKTSSCGTFSPSVRVNLIIFLLLAPAACFSIREASMVGVIRLKTSDFDEGVGGNTAMRGSVGERGMVLSWRISGGGRWASSERRCTNGFSVE
jgi:hypothetical protein